MTNGHVLNGHVGGNASHLDARGRLLECALRLTVLEDYAQLSAIQIADEAGVSLDSYFDLFNDVQECFLAAFDEMSDELLWAIADLELVGEDWPRAVRKAIGALMRHLAPAPAPRPDDRYGGVHRRARGDRAHAASPAQEITTLLIGGEPPSGLTACSPSRVSRARSGTRSAAGSRVGRSTCFRQSQTIWPMWCWAPFIGAEAAAEIVTEEQLQPASGLALIGGGGGSASDACARRSARARCRRAATPRSR